MNPDSGVVSRDRDGRPPIPYSEILRTSWIMEEIFSQLNSAQNGDPGSPRKYPVATSR